MELDPKIQATDTPTTDPKAALDSLEVAQGQVVADLGCGNGFYVIPAAQMVGGSGMVYAVDILKQALATVQSKARRRGLTNIKLIWTNLEKPGATKIPDQSVDIAWIVHVFHQSTQRTKVAKEAFRMLKPGGKLAVVEWSKQAIPMGPPVEKRVSKEDAQKSTEEAGFKFSKEINAGAYHYGLAFVKP